MVVTITVHTYTSPHPLTLAGEAALVEVDALHTHHLSPAHLPAAQTRDGNTPPGLPTDAPGPPTGARLDLTWRGEGEVGRHEVGRRGEDRKGSFLHTADW